MSIPNEVAEFIRSQDAFGFLDGQVLGFALFSDEFQSAYRRRAADIQAGRPSGLMTLADYPEHSCSAVYLIQEGGSTWNCACSDSRWRETTRNHWCCKCEEPDLFERDPGLYDRAQEATERWIADWETQNGSRFRPVSEILADLKEALERNRAVYSVAQLG